MQRQLLDLLLLQAHELAEVGTFGFDLRGGGEARQAAMRADVLRHAVERGQRIPGRKDVIREGRQADAHLLAPDLALAGDFEDLLRGRRIGEVADGEGAGVVAGELGGVSDVRWLIEADLGQHRSLFGGVHAQLYGIVRAAVADVGAAVAGDDEGLGVGSRRVAVAQCDGQAFGARVAHDGAHGVVKGDVGRVIDDKADLVGTCRHAERITGDRCLADADTARKLAASADSELDAIHPRERADGDRPGVGIEDRGLHSRDIAHAIDQQRRTRGKQLVVREAGAVAEQVDGVRADLEQGIDKQGVQAAGRIADDAELAIRIKTRETHLRQSRVPHGTQHDLVLDQDRGLEGHGAVDIQLPHQFGGAHHRQAGVGIGAADADIPTVGEGVLGTEANGQKHKG